MFDIKHKNVYIYNLIDKKIIVKVILFNSFWIYVEIYKKT